MAFVFFLAVILQEKIKMNWTEVLRPKTSYVILNNSHPLQFVGVLVVQGLTQISTDKKANHK